MLYQEPSWWVYLEQQSHAFLLQSSPFVQDLVSLFADIFDNSNKGIIQHADNL